MHYAWLSDAAFIFAASLTNEVPSALFSVSLSSDADDVLRIGISIEPVQSVAQQQHTKTALTSHQVALKVARHFHNYVSSFPQSSTQGIPLALLDKWFQGFEKKIASNPAFLEAL